MSDWKNKIKWGINRVVEKGVIDSINAVGDFLENDPEISKSSVQTAVGAIGAAGRDIRKDDILGAMGNCGKSGLVGATIDGFLSAGHAGKMYYAGVIDKEILTRYIAQEAGCGFVSSTAGTAGTMVVKLVTGSMGPAALIAGMGASVGSRYLYRSLVEDVLPDLDDLEEEENEQDLEDILEEIDQVWAE